MGDVLAILFEPTRKSELLAIRVLHPCSRLVLLTTPEASADLSGLVDEVWPEAAQSGPSHFLALMRRIAWASFAHIYDLEARPLTRFMRHCIWPRPAWHVGAERLPFS
jgi:hypothetical protein